MMMTVFRKILKAAVAVMMMVLLGNITQTNAACACLAVYFTPCDYVVGVPSAGTSLVVRATALSRSVQTKTGINDPIIYTVKATTVFLGDTGGEDTVSFVTAGSSAACGIVLDIGEEYVLGLSPAVDKGQLTVHACGLWRKWSDIPDQEKAALEEGCST